MNNDESYIVLARKYRPKKLSDLIGQEEVAEIIEGSVKLNRVAHSFLFSGTRGVGKTTIARILAKIVNCNSIDVKSVDPCGKCENCVSIDKESNIDISVIECPTKLKDYLNLYYFSCATKIYTHPNFDLAMHYVNQAPQYGKCDQLKMTKQNQISLNDKQKSLEPKNIN